MSCSSWGLFLVLLFWGFAPAAAQTSTAASATDPVTLQPGDLIQIDVWREEDLSGIFPVNECGVVTLPMLGDKQVTHIPMDELRDVLIGEYRVQLRNPSIQIIPLRKVLVLGAVNKPGPYEVDPTTSVLGVIAQAEGVAPGGNVKQIRILRGGEVIQERVAPEVALSNLDVRSGDQIEVGQRSWLERNRSFVVSVLLAIPSVIYTITRINP